MDKFSNPFNITKATDFTDEEIINYWVDFPGHSFTDVIKPVSPMPMIILGGKGSGKTHIMKYFSYELQKIRSQSDVLTEINQCGYIGIYMRCGGMNSNRFQGKSQENHKWIAIFQYYLELWISQLLLNIIIDIFEKEPSLKDYDESITKYILTLFDKIPDDATPTTLKDLVILLNQLQKQTDIIVNNAGITKDLSNLFIFVSPGKLIFGIPKILESTIVFFKDIRFLYLIDEFENLPVDHQIHINTLVREREDPTTFKIGSRLYGVKTYKTFSADEDNKEGSEFELFSIDQYFREKKEYNEFIAKLCYKRLIETEYPVTDKEHTVKNFEQYFEKFDLDVFLKIISETKSPKPYFSRLKEQLSDIENTFRDDIAECLSYPTNPLIEKTNILLFYRGWKRAKIINGHVLLAIAQDIRLQREKYFGENPQESSLHKVLDKFKTDIVAQLFLDFQYEIPYYGFEAFINMSDGLPRNLLGILKYIFKKSYFSAEKPFHGGRISLESQIRGIKDASEWFIEDARMPGDNGKKSRKSIIRLATFLRELRFADIPPECSLCAFSIDLSTTSDEIAEEIKNCYLNSYLIKISETRKERNSERLDSIFQINGMLAPRWALPIYRRGEIQLKKEDAAAIFTDNTEDIFKTYLKSRVRSYNAPFKNKDIIPQTLFSNGN
jgi:hypothetical protein